MNAHLPSPADPAKPLVLVDWQLDALLAWYTFDESWSSSSDADP
jgi:hypothetical protein